MKIIGITGGVGAGKSTVLHMLKELCNCRIVMADDEAKKLMNKGGALEDAAVRLFGLNAYREDGTLNTGHIAEIFYKNPSKQQEWNNLVHPAVNNYIHNLIDETRKEGKFDYLFIEAALLIENGYDSICDEIWYVYADADTRIKRLSNDRGYSKDKSVSIMKKQLSDEEFRKNCSFVIDTGMDLSYTRTILKNRLEQYS